MDHENLRRGFEGTVRGLGRGRGLRGVAVVADNGRTDRSAIERASLLPLHPDARIVPVGIAEELRADGRRGFALLPASEEHAEAPRPELVVVARGPRDLRSRLFGSTAERLVRAADYPVLVTTLPARRPYAQVLITTDFSPVAAEALTFALRILPPGAPEPRVLHAYDTCYALVLRMVNAPPERLLAYQTQAREDAEARMEEFLDGLGAAGSRVRPICRPGDPVGEIRRYLRSLRAELLVVGKHAEGGAGRPLLGSIAERCLRVAPCDVMVVPGRPQTLH